MPPKSRFHCRDLQSMEHPGLVLICDWTHRRLELCELRRRIVYDTHPT